MLDELRELWRYRELLLILVQRDLKVRYKNSALGFGWSLVNPLVQVVTITLMLQFIAKFKAESFHLYAFCAMLPWLYFSVGTLDASPSLLSYYGLLRRTYFPREVIPLSVIAANLIHFLLATAVFLVYSAGNALFFWAVNGTLHWPIEWTVLLIPLPILGLTLLLTGVGMFISVWTLHFEDVRFIADSLMKILYWLVPVLYFADLVRLRKGEWIYTLYMLNPLSCFISTFRKLVLPPTKIVLGEEPETKIILVTTAMTGQDWLFLGIAFAVSLGVALAGHRYFCARKWSLAERA
jgi:ABC-type polysaccharide/polyol phosphate export permease